MSFLEAYRYWNEDLVAVSARVYAQVARSLVRSPDTWTPDFGPSYVISESTCYGEQIEREGRKEIF